jgi:hypothetical protein
MVVGVDMGTADGFEAAERGGEGRKKKGGRSIMMEKAEIDGELIVWRRRERQPRQWARPNPGRV